MAILRSETLRWMCRLGWERTALMRALDDYGVNGQLFGATVSFAVL